jgi:peptide/nickel transport system substrate-binding protein
VAALGGAGADVAVAAPSAERRSTLVVATLQDVDSLNPFVGSSVTASQLFRSMFDYLTDYDPRDNRSVPGLARSWSTSPDGRTWTFRLRDGVRWSDGRALTAGDVAFTYRTIMARPALATSALLRNVQSVEAPDDGTVVIRTVAPTPTMLSLDVPIVPAHVWAGRDPAAAVTDPAVLVGSGPFRLTAARQGVGYELARNPGYWRGAPRIDRLVYRYLTNGDAAVQALLAGEVDVVGNLTPAQYEALGRDRRIGRNVARGSRLTELGLNAGAARADGVPLGDGHPALRDVRVRRAIDHAIDRDVLVRRVLGGQGDPGAGYLPPTYRPWGWRPAPASLRGYDPGEAARILDSAGYRVGADGVRVMPGGGRRLSFTVLVPNGRAHYEQSATYLVDWLRAVGIELRVQVMSDADKAARVAAGRYDMFLGGWVLDPDPDFLLSVQTCDARPDAGGTGTTDTFLCDPEYDRLYTLQSRQLDPAARAATVWRMQRRLQDGAGLLVLYYPGVLEAYRSDRFTGLVRRPAASGSVAGPWSFAVARPVAAPAREDRLPIRTLVAVGLVALVVAVVGAVARATRDRRQ